MELIDILMLVFTVLCILFMIASFIAFSRLREKEIRQDIKGKILGKDKKLEHLSWVLVELKNGSKHWYVYLEDEDCFYRSYMRVYWIDVSKVLTQ